MNVGPHVCVWGGVGYVSECIVNTGQSPVPYDSPHCHHDWVLLKQAGTLETNEFPGQFLDMLVSNTLLILVLFSSYIYVFLVKDNALSLLKCLLISYRSNLMTVF